MEAKSLRPVRFGDYLINRQALSEAQLLDVLAEHWVSGNRIGEVAVRRGYLPKAEVERLAAEFDGLSTVYV